MKMNHLWIAVWLAAICCYADSRADEGRETINAIQNDFHKYFDCVSKMSVRISWSVSFNGDDMTAYTFDSITDGRNRFERFVRLYNNYPYVDKDPRAESLSSWARISRIRGRYRQGFILRRKSPTSTWVLTRDTSEPLTKDNESLSFDEEGALHQLAAMRFAPGDWITTIPRMIQSPGFRLGSVTEDRSGPERLVTVEFTIAPPLDPKAVRRPLVQAGRMQLRPDAYWTLKSGTFHLDESHWSGKCVQYKVTNTFHEDSEKKALPKEVKQVATVITEDGKKAEEIKRATFEFSSYTQVPEERLSLTQFGMSEREPVEPVAEAEPSSGAERDTKQYLVAYNPYSLPAYVWLTASGVLLLVIGLALRFWMTKSMVSQP
jgi:hypothetical protein